MRYNDHMRLSKLIQRNLILAAGEGRLFIEVDFPSYDYLCENCGKKEPTVLLSICANQDDLENDPCSGEIVWLGSECFRQLRKKFRSIDRVARKK